MAKHTAAPWLIAGEDKTFVYALGPMETNKFWAHVQYAGPEKISKEEAAANALLIAAAPELLEALQGMLGAWNMICDANGWERDHLQQQKDAVAAIEKATGQCLKGEE